MEVEEISQMLAFESTMRWKIAKNGNYHALMHHEHFESYLRMQIYLVPSWRAIVMMVLKSPLYWGAAGPCTNTALPAFTATAARPSPCICNQLHTLVTNKLSKNQMDRWADREKEI